MFTLSPIALAAAVAATASLVLTGCSNPVDALTNTPTPVVEQLSADILKSNIGHDESPRDFANWLTEMRILEKIDPAKVTGGYYDSRQSVEDFVTSIGLVSRNGAQGPDRKAMSQETRDQDDARRAANSDVSRIYQITRQYPLATADPHAIVNLFGAYLTIAESRGLTNTSPDDEVTLGQKYTEFLTSAGLAEYL